jgi:hypothetical protein
MVTNGLEAAGENIDNARKGRGPELLVLKTESPL